MIVTDTRPANSNLIINNKVVISTIRLTSSYVGGKPHLFILKKTILRKNMKLQAVKLLGGKCSICGYSKCIDALEFHHKNPKEKDFKI